jgi:hypothetical protein
VQSQLFTRVACNYVKLIISGSENIHRETFFKRFPSLVCQAVYTVFCRAFPTSYRQFDDRFKQDLADVTYLWIVGNYMAYCILLNRVCDACQQSVDETKLTLFILNSSTSSKLFSLEVQ